MNKYNIFLVALWAEILKAWKSRILWGTVIFFIVVPGMMSLIMFAQMHPEISAKLGIIGDKAEMMKFGDASWPSFFKLLMMGLAGIGPVGIGFVTSWIFGREFSENTFKDIIVLPISRHYIVMAKFVVVAMWSVLLSIIFYAVSLLIGFSMELPEFSKQALSQNVVIFTITTLLNITLCTPVAFFACYSRGYLVPFGFVILTLIMANFSGLLGLGPYFPWSIPGLIGMPPGTEGMELTIASYIILILSSLLGLLGTLAFWRFADHS